MELELIPGIDMVELLGYAASAVVLASFFMKKMLWLRGVNSVGCCLFTVYGIFLDWAWPIIITNGAIFAVNIFYLLKKKS